MSYLYRFNFSSYTFESLADGSLFEITESSGVVSVDGQNIVGKYKVLGKTANFFSNSFTWIIVMVCIIAVAIVLWGVRRYLKKKAREEYR